MAKANNKKNTQVTISEPQNQSQDAKAKGGKQCGPDGTTRPGKPAAKGGKSGKKK